MARGNGVAALCGDFVVQRKRQGDRWMRNVRGGHSPTPPHLLPPSLATAAAAYWRPAASWALKYGLSRASGGSCACCAGVGATGTPHGWTQAVWELGMRSHTMQSL